MRPDTSSKPAPFGQTGISIPPIGYGTSFIGNLNRIIDDDVKLNIMKNWFAAGHKPVWIGYAKEDISLATKQWVQIELDILGSRNYRTGRF